MPYRVALVCLGNICRSPTADVVLNRLADDAGLEDVLVESCGTGDWHLGEPMDQRSALALQGRGYETDAHRARHFDATWFDHDLILVMDAANLRDVLDQLPEDRHDRVKMFRSFDPEADDADPVAGTGPDVPDPWFGGAQGFLDVLETVERTSRAIVERLRTQSRADAGA